MSKIKSITACEIIDTRGNPTVESMVELDSGEKVKSSAPSGIVNTANEAVLLKDDNKNRFNGMGVLNVVENVNKIIAPQLIGIDIQDQKHIDNLLVNLDGTPNKSKLGANATLSVSQAVAKAAAKSINVPLYEYLKRFIISKNNTKKIPVPLFNLIEGGKHVVNNYGFQEFLLFPASSKSFAECMEMGINTYYSLRKLMYEKGFSTLSAEEGGFTSQSSSNQETLNILKQAVSNTNYKLSFDVFLGIDANANAFRINNVYKLIDRSATYDSNELLAFYEGLCSEPSLIYLEDPIADDDIQGWKNIFQKLSSKVLIIGDDLTVTSPYRLQNAINEGLINGIVIKPSQIGTVMETIAVCEIAKYKNLKVVVSGRSGETMDNFIADFAVGVGADYVKFGAPVRERVAKYNKLLEIEREIKPS